MQYILTLYVNEGGWPKLTKAEQEQGMAADAAISWAARCPAVGHGVVEVRPLWSTTGA